MKRFTVFGEWHKDNIIDEIRDNGDTLSIGEIVELLNELHEENEELKSEIAKLSYANEDLLEEKRQWKILSDKYAELYDENEQLKTLNIPLDEVKEIVLDYKKRVERVYYND